MSSRPRAGCAPTATSRSGLRGGITLGSRAFGLVGEFKFYVFLTEVPKPGFPGETEYAFGAGFSASVDARLFGITLAGVSLLGRVVGAGLRGDGPDRQGHREDQDPVRHGLQVGELQDRDDQAADARLPGRRRPRQDSENLGTASFSGGALYLNMGNRADPNSVPSPAAASATPTRTSRSRSSTSRAPPLGARQGEGRRREKIYEGVTKIYAFASDGDDTIIIREGVLVDVELHGGTGDDQLLYYGSGAAKLYGEGGDDFIETGASTAGVVEIYGGGRDDFLRHNGTGGATIEGGIGDDVLRGSSAVDTLRGGDGSDDIDGRGGLDNLFGDAGDDVLKVSLPGAGTFPTVEGGAGGDILVLTLSAGDDNVLMSNPGGNDVKVARANATGNVEADDVEEVDIDLGRRRRHAADLDAGRHVGQHDPGRLRPHRHRQRPDDGDHRRRRQQAGRPGRDLRRRRQGRHGHLRGPLGQRHDDAHGRQPGQRRDDRGPDHARERRRQLRRRRLRGPHQALRARHADRRGSRGDDLLDASAVGDPDLTAGDVFPDLVTSSSSAATATTG